MFYLEILKFREQRYYLTFGVVYRHPVASNSDWDVQFEFYGIDNPLYNEDLDFSILVNVKPHRKHENIEQIMAINNSLLWLKPTWF